MFFVNQLLEEFTISAVHFFATLTSIQPRESLEKWPRVVVSFPRTVKSKSEQDDTLRFWSKVYYASGFAYF